MAEVWSFIDLIALLILGIAILGLLLSSISLLWKLWKTHPCPVCGLRETAEITLLWPGNRRSFVCRHCHMWFDKIKK